MTYWVTKYWQLLLLRLLTGISLGGIFPLVFSLLGDLFSVHQRAFVAALVQIAMGFGMSLGQLIAGVIGELAPGQHGCPFRSPSYDCLRARFYCLKKLHVMPLCSWQWVPGVLGL